MRKNIGHILTNLELFVGQTGLKRPKIIFDRDSTGQVILLRFPKVDCILQDVLIVMARRI
jgi:hypothetical protein